MARENEKVSWRKHDNPKQYPSFFFNWIQLMAFSLLAKHDTNTEKGKNEALLVG